MCAGVGEVISHLRDHPKQIRTRLRDRRIADMGDPAGVVRGGLGTGVNASAGNPGGSLRVNETNTGP